MPIAFSVSILHRPNVIADDGINQLYNVADIGINTSDGEGYGLCQLEHLYTGAPQVVTDVGAYSDFLDTELPSFVPGDFYVYHAGGMPLGNSGARLPPQARFPTRWRPRPLISPNDARGD
jgi:hypothetical protein